MSTKQSNIASTMAELMALKGSSVKGFKRGQKIEAKLAEVTSRWATFKIGGKSEGVITGPPLLEARDILSTLKVGDVVTATVIDPETPDGFVLLSLRYAAAEKFWQNLAKAQEDNKPIEVTVKTAAPRGVTVDLDGFICFIPVSQIGKVASKNVEDLVGQRIRVKVLEVDRRTKRIILSERAFSEEGEIREKEKLMAAFTEGTYEGKVTEIANYGVFVTLAVPGKKGVTVEGMIHISELSWQKVKEPSEVAKVGQDIKVKVIGTRDGRLMLSAKKAQSDPWETNATKYSADMKLGGKVTRLSDFGAFVELEPGIEGLIHITKIPPAMKLTVGQEVNVYVEEIDAKERRISLGLVLTSKPVGYK